MTRIPSSIHVAVTRDCIEAEPKGTRSPVLGDHSSQNAVPGNPMSESLSRTCAQLHGETDCFVSDGHRTEAFAVTPRRQSIPEKAAGLDPVAGRKRA
jgi:hypothetical protein